MKSSKIDRLIKRIDPDLIDDDLLKWFKLFGNSAQVFINVVHLF